MTTKEPEKAIVQEVITCASYACIFRYFVFALVSDSYLYHSSRSLI